MIVSSKGKKPQIHASAYVAPTAVVSGDVTVGSGCAILHGAAIVAEGAPVAIGSDSVVMEYAVLRASGGKAMQFALTIGERTLVGPHAYLCGADIGEGCYVASGAKVLNGAALGEGSHVGSNAIVDAGAKLPEGSSIPIAHVAAGDPATIFPPERAAEAAAATDFFRTVFNLEPDSGVGGRAAETYAKFLRRMHAADAAAGEHRAAKPTVRRSGDEPPPTQAVEVDKVVDVMMLELEEMEHRRQESIARKKGR